MDAKESAKEDDLPFGFFCKLLCLDLSVVEVVLWSCHCRHKNVNRRIPGKFISEENAIQWMQNARPVFVLENQIIPFFTLLVESLHAQCPSLLHIPRQTKRSRLVLKYIKLCSIPLSHLWYFIASIANRVHHHQYHHGQPRLWMSTFLFHFFDFSPCTEKTLNSVSRMGNLWIHSLKVIPTF